MEPYQKNWSQTIHKLDQIKERTRERERERPGTHRDVANKETTGGVLPAGPPAAAVGMASPRWTAVPPPWGAPISSLGTVPPHVSLLCRGNRVWSGRKRRGEERKSKREWWMTAVLLAKSKIRSEAGAERKYMRWIIGPFRYRAVQNNWAVLSWWMDEWMNAFMDHWLSTDRYIY